MTSFFRILLLLAYNLLYPVFLLVSLPGYLVKMRRRGGFGTGLLERFGLYRVPAAAEPKGGIYIHAVSVGEVFIALKFIREWNKEHTGPVVLATSTATGHAVARQAGIPNVRVLYAPLDLPLLPGRCLKRFAPRAVVLIEAELWPNFAESCHRRGIPLLMLNARLSPRSESRYAAIRPITRILFSRLNALGAQNDVDAHRFSSIGINPFIIHVTGSIKFDVLGDAPTAPRDEFRMLLDYLRRGRPVVLAASTHAGEERLIATAAREAGAFPLIVPRHAERRDEVVRDLTDAGFRPILRTQQELPDKVPENACYVADTTGELRDWTALADVVVIGKSFLAAGGQNPVEAIAARIPVITGPDMTNFADLVRLLESHGGICRCMEAQLALNISHLLVRSPGTMRQVENAFAALRVHSGATARSVQLVESLIPAAQD